MNVLVVGSSPLAVQVATALAASGCEVNYVRSDPDGTDEPRGAGIKVVAGDPLVVLEEARLAEGKTRALAERFEKLGWGSVLIISGAELDENFARAARNLPQVDVLPQQGANVYDILRRDTLVLTRDAVQQLEARLK